MKYRLSMIRKRDDVTSALFEVEKATLVGPPRWKSGGVLRYHHKDAKLEMLHNNGEKLCLWLSKPMADWQDLNGYLEARASEIADHMECVEHEKIEEMLGYETPQKTDDENESGRQLRDGLNRELVDDMYRWLDMPKYEG